MKTNRNVTVTVSHIRTKIWFKSFSKGGNKTSGISNLSRHCFVLPFRKRVSTMSVSQVNHMRPDQDECSKVKALIVAMTTTQDWEQFQKMAMMAPKIFNEQNISTINALVKNGALMLVSNRLLKAVFKEPGSSEEVNLLSDALAALLRCDGQWTHEFVLQLGVTLVYDLLYYLQTRREVSPTLDKAHALLRRLATLPWSTLPKQPYEALVRVLQETIRAPSTDQIAVSTIYFLSELADDAEQKGVLVELPGLVEDVLKQVARCLHADKCKEEVVFACRFLRRLAWGPANRAILSKKKNWNKVLVDMAVKNTDACVKKEAIRTIWQMSTEFRSRRFMVKYKDAALIKQLAQSLDDPTFGLVAVNALSNLIDTDSAKKLASHHGIFISLSTLAIQAETPMGIKAAQVLKRMAGKISICDQGHDELLDALICCASSPRHQVRSWAAKGLLVQSESSANAFFFTRSQLVLNVITKLSADQDPTVRRTAIQTLFNAASEASNTRRAACTTRYLNAFISDALGYNEAADEESLATTRLSIKGILRLSDHPKSYHRVAKQNGAIEALARYGVSLDTDLELKGAALHAVVLLSPFL